MLLASVRERVRKPRAARNMSQGPGKPWSPDPPSPFLIVWHYRHVPPRAAGRKGGFVYKHVSLWFLNAIKFATSVRGYAFSSQG